MNHSIQNGPPPSQPRQSRFKMGPPPTSLPPPSILTAQFTSVPPPMINLPSQMQSPTIAEKVITGMDSAPSSFDLRNKLLGVGGANLQYMRNETGAMVTLRGKGSGFIEPSTGTESLEPLHFYIEHPRPEGVREARTLAINLIETLQQELQQQQQQQPQQQQTHLFAFQQGALQTVQLGSVGQTGLLTLPHEVLQQAGLVTTSIGNINVPTILTQQHVGPLVAPPPPLSVPPPNIVQSQHIQQQQQLLQAQVQQQVQLPPPGVHIPTQQGPLVPPQQQQSQPPQQSSQTQSVLHQVHQFQLAPTNQQPPQIQQHLLAQPPPPIQQVLLSQAPPTVTSQAQTQQVLGLFHQPPPQTPQQTQQSLYVQAGLPLLHQPPPMVNAQLQFQIPPQQTQGSHQQQIISVPPPPPPPPQQSQTQTSQANQQVQANFISQSVPMHYTLQFQQTNPTSSTASLIQAPPHQSILDHQQAHQIQQQSQSQSNQLLQNQGGFVMTTPGSQSLVQVPPPVQMHHGVMAPPHLQPPQQQASVAVPLPVPAPAPPHSSSQVSSAMSTSFQPGIMTQSGMPIHQQQLPPHLQQHLHYQLPPGRQSPMHGQTAPHGPSSPASQQSQKDSKSPGSQENGQATRQGAAQNQSNGQQHQERRSSPQPLQRQGIGIEELIQMNHQQRQQLSVEPGSAQNGRQGPAPRDKTVMQQPSSAIGQGW